MNDPAARLPLVRSGITIVIVFGLVAAVLIATGRRDYPDLHTVLDTSMCLLSGVLALLFWDLGARLDRPFSRCLAASFAVTTLAELIHVLVTIEWFGSFAPIMRAAYLLRPATWPLAAHVLPVGMGATLVMMRLGGRSTAGFALLLLAFTAALFPVFLSLPRYTAPAWLGITRPALFLAPLLWAVTGVGCWLTRTGDRILPAAAAMAGIMALAHTAMLYSQAPHDTMAMVAHVGKVAAYLLLLSAIMQMAASDTLERLRAEQRLAEANAALERRVSQRTAELEQANASLEQENQVRRRAEDQLKQNQQLLQSIIDNATAVIYVKDLQGRYLLVNRRFSELFHLDVGEILGRTDHDIFAKEAADAFRAMDQRVAAAGIPLTEEETAPHDDGPHVYLSVKAPLRDDEGNIRGIFGISTDITERKQAERAIRASEERTRLVIETALDAVITMDASGMITAWSPQAEATFGWPHAEAIGSSLADLIIPERFRERHRRGLERYLETGEGPVLNKRIELSALHRSGVEFPIELSITPLRTDATVAFSAFVRDITESRRAAAALAASEKQYRLIFEESPLPKWIYDLETLRFIAVNRAAREHYGYSAEEFLAMTIRDIRPGADITALETDIELARRGRSGPGEWRHRRKDGTLIQVLVNAHDIELGGRRARLVVSQDITERKQAEVKVQAQLARLDLLHQITRAIGERQDLQSIYQVAVRSLEDHLAIDLCCICSYDNADQTLTVTRVGVRSEALALELALSRNAQVPIDENGLSRCVRGHLVYEHDISEVAFPFPQRLARGGLRSLVVAPLLVESQVFGVMVAARRTPSSFSSGECEFLKHLSEHVALAANQAQLYAALQKAYDDLRQTQQAIMQQERLRALGQMASGVAHDINNAISPAALYVESLLEKERALGPGAREQLLTIQHALEDVAQTVARMREFYRQREPQLLLEPLEPNVLVQQVIELTRARWHDMPQQLGHVIQLQMDLSPDVPAILGLESDIREALTNLVFNAVDAMPNGGLLTLRTRVEQLAPFDKRKSPGKIVRLEVADTGIGMDEEIRRRCLEPFFTTKGERGTGLGLAMVYGMVQRHGADIQIDSAVGRGTTMTLVFPAPAVAPSRPEAEELPAARPRLRLLVVDDDPLLIKSLRDTLEADGHLVVTATDGRAGINAFHAARTAGEPFALVITDLGMPYVDGRKVAAEVKTASPETPVILLTGWGQRLAADGDIPPHVDRLLSKPPKLRELRAALAELTAAP